MWMQKENNADCTPPRVDVKFHVCYIRQTDSYRTNKGFTCWICPQPQWINSIYKCIAFCMDKSIICFILSASRIPPGRVGLKKVNLLICIETIVNAVYTQHSKNNTKNINPIETYRFFNNLGWALSPVRASENIILFRPWTPLAPHGAPRPEKYT